MDITALLGKTAISIANNEDEIRFFMSDGTQYLMHHQQNCCEDVRVEDICGDLEDLIGTPFVMAEESSELGIGSEFESSTWTFYKLGTNKGSVTIRWFGSSNGYYSESVSFEEIPKSTIPDGYGFGNNF